MSDAVAKYKVGKQTFTILFPDLLRPLTKAEEVRLRKSIRKEGVHVPVVVDEAGGVIDGGNRVRLAAEVGLAHIHTDVRKGLTPEQKVELAHLLNDTRRHLSAKDREAAEKARDERLKQVAELKARGMSLRAISEEVGVSPEQVRQDLERSTVNHLTVEQVTPDKVIGLDGKARPAERLSAEEQAERDAKIAEAVAAGKTTRQVAEQFGVAVGTVSAAVKRHAEAAADDDPFAPPESEDEPAEDNAGDAEPDSQAEPTAEPEGNSRHMAGISPGPAPGEETAPKKARKPKEKQEEVRDDLGRVVPPRLRDVFADTAVRELAQRLGLWAGQLSPESAARTVSKRGPAYPYLDASVVMAHVGEAVAELTAAKSYVEQNLPHAVCPECDGAGFREGDGGCDGCRASGYVTAWRLDELKLEGRA